jgi:hypothetical protein
MGWAGTWHEWESVEVHIVFWWENPEEQHHVEDLGIDGKISERTFIGWEGTDWICLVQDSGKWRAVVNTVMNLIFCCPCIIVHQYNETNDGSKTVNVAQPTNIVCT